MLIRQWVGDVPAPSAPLVQAIESLDGLLPHLKRRLANELRGIYIGPGGVPALDQMGWLRGLPYRGRDDITWDAVAGRYDEGVAVIGDLPNASRDVALHEVGHALDDLDGMRSANDEMFLGLHALCRPVLVG